MAEQGPISGPPPIGVLPQGPRAFIAEVLTFSLNQGTRLLLTLLRVDYGPLQIGAVKLLRWLRDYRAIEPVAAMLSDKDVRVRQAVAETLVSLKWQPPDDAQRARLAIAQLRWGDAASLGGAAVEPLIAVLGDRDAMVRRCSAASLGLIADGRAVPALVALLNDGMADVRRAAAGSLAQVGAASVDALVAVLASPTSSAVVRSLAAEALGKTGESRALASLLIALRDKDLHARREAARAAGALGWRPADDSERALQVVALQNWDEAAGIGKLAVEPLINVLREGPDEMRRPTAHALEKVGTPSVEALVAILTGGLPVVRRIAAEVLGKIGDTRAVEPLAALLSDAASDVRAAAALALGKIADTRATKPLLVALQDATSEVRQAASEALEGINSPEAKEALAEYLENSRRLALATKLKLATLRTKGMCPRCDAWVYFRSDQQPGHCAHHPREVLVNLQVIREEVVEAPLCL
jgi:HEAT repeat protein